MARKYTASIDGGQGGQTVIMARDEQAAIRRAVAWVRDGDWNSTATIWVDLRIEDARGDLVCIQSVSVNPDPPDCVESDHDWIAPVEVVGGCEENPGVWGHGGGVIIHEICRHCGVTRRCDTWAQNPATGEEGLDAVKYDAECYHAEWEAWSAAYTGERGSRIVARSHAQKSRAGSEPASHHQVI
jgi:hypothetical protein